MPRLSLRLSRPLYEGLPWIYVAAGLTALVGSYRSASRSFSWLMGVLGLLAVLAGIVVLLRRRDYRELRSQYGDPDALRDPRQD